MKRITATEILESNKCAKKKLRRMSKELMNKSVEILEPLILEICKLMLVKSKAADLDIFDG